MSAYYNELEPYAAEWLRELIKKGHIADGVVDTRSIVEVEAGDLLGFAQCHFFAGIGVWSHALRLAGWPDERPVWTGSCPCQPFSAAGKGKGFEDERHLWPHFHRLISECSPAVVFGEQVASKDGLNWLDTVFADLEGSGYAAAAVDLCAAGVGAPHIRQRLWFVGERLADASPGGRGEQRDALVEGSGRHPDGSGRHDRMGHADRPRHEGHGLQPLLGGGEGRGAVGGAAGSGATGGVGHDDDARLEGQRGGHQAEGGWVGAVRPVAEAGEPRGLADASDEGSSRAGRNAQCQGSLIQPGDGSGEESTTRPGPTNGHWGAADWLHCRDGKWRPVEPGTFPLAHGAPSRVGRLRAYGNAIVPQVAAEVISSYMEIER